MNSRADLACPISGVAEVGRKYQAKCVLKLERDAREMASVYRIIERPTHSTHLSQTWWTGLCRYSFQSFSLPLPLSPLRKLLPLPSDVHKPRSRLQYRKWISPEVLLILPGQALLALALNLARPHIPANRTELGAAKNKPQNNNESRYYGFGGYVKRQRGRRGGRRVRGYGRGEDGVFLGGVAAGRC